MATLEARLAYSIRTAHSNPRPAVWLADAERLERWPEGPNRARALAMAATLRRLAAKHSR